jgi:hypothetical protein
MNSDSRVRFLRFVLVLTGLISIFGVYPMRMSLWPSGSRWQPNQPEYQRMIVGAHATLGILPSGCISKPSVTPQLDSV